MGKKSKTLDLFQICDSTFPIGSFNHSFGMENYLSDGLRRLMILIFG